MKQKIKENITMLLVILCFFGIISIISYFSWRPYEFKNKLELKTEEEIKDSIQLDTSYIFNHSKITDSTLGNGK